MKVAIVCDWLTGIGGAERVVYELHKMYPKAPIYTSQYNPRGIDWFNDADVHTLWLQKLPPILKKFLPALRAMAFSNLDLSDYDLVLSSSGAEAKGIKTGPNTIHICYMHSPTQYYWVRYKEYLRHPGFPPGFNWLAKFGLRVLVGPLKQWDKQAGQHPDYIVTNSNYTKDNIHRAYRREASVVYPPVETDRFKVIGKPLPRHGAVIAGRQTPYKRIDLAVEACKLAHEPLVVIGNGPMHKKLEKLGNKHITFLTNVNDHDIVKHFQSAKAFIMPNADDFGITAVEAMAAGTPVIAYTKGGSQDYMLPGKTGILFKRQTAHDVSNAIEVVMNKKFDYKAIAEHAQEFSVEAFHKSMQAFIDKCLKERAA